MTDKEIKRIPRFQIRSKYCGTLVSNKWYDEYEANKTVKDYNKEAINMYSDVRYEKVQIDEKANDLYKIRCV